MVVLNRQTVKKLRLAVLFAVLALTAIGILLVVESLPAPWVWLLFAVAFVFFEWRAVEVNDKLVASPSVMVALTAGVAFGPGSAALGVTLMAALALLTPADLAQRRWFQPIANSSQLAISAAIAISVLEFFLPDVVQASNLWLIALGSAVAACVYLIINFNLVQFGVFSIFGRSQIRPWSNMASLIIPYVGMGFLGGLLGAAYVLVGAVALPSIFVVFYIGYMTFASYSQLREAQTATLRGFVKALEAKDLYTRGHTERVAYFAELIGAELGFNGTQLERIRWAALIHDVGKLAVPRHLLRKRSRLTENEYGQMQRHVHLVEDLLAEVDFLQPMVEIASNHHAHYDGNGYHGPSHTHGHPPTIEACILAVADSFDAMTSTRSYRVALSQQYAFQELKAHAGTQFDPDVVEAFERALIRTKQTFGSPDVHSEEEARRRAEEMAIG